MYIFQIWLFSGYLCKSSRGEDHLLKRVNQVPNLPNLLNFHDHYYLLQLEDILLSLWAPLPAGLRDDFFREGFLWQKNGRVAGHKSEIKLPHTTGNRHVPKKKSTPICFNKNYQHSNLPIASQNFPPKKIAPALEVAEISNWWCPSVSSTARASARLAQKPPGLPRPWKVTLIIWDMVQYTTRGVFQKWGKTHRKTSKYTTFVKVQYLETDLKRILRPHIVRNARVLVEMFSLQPPRRNRFICSLCKCWNIPPAGHTKVSANRTSQSSEARPPMIWMIFACITDQFPVSFSKLVPKDTCKKPIPPQFHQFAFTGEGQIQQISRLFFQKIWWKQLGTFIMWNCNSRMMIIPCIKKSIKRSFWFQGVCVCVHTPWN